MKPDRDKRAKVTKDKGREDKKWKKKEMGKKRRGKLAARFIKIHFYRIPG